MHNVIHRARLWLKQDVDPETKGELQKLIDGEAEPELADRFSGRLEFGTAGIRGILGAGPMRMNRVVVRQVSAGLADYVLATVSDAAERGIVVAYDARRNSRVFAEDAARVFAGKGIKVHMFAREVPTPVAAFAVLDTNAAAGVMVTASHNPPQYNGYKVYWENGAQIIPPHDIGIATAIEKIEDIGVLEMPELVEARGRELIVELGEQIEQRYLRGVRELSVRPQAATESSITIAYTALHGVGARFVKAAMDQAGFTSFYSEKSQNDPDPEFPTVSFPNPEEEGAMDRVLALAVDKRADLVLANDPDADRLAVAVPEAPGESDSYRMLTGDQIGALLADYLLHEGSRETRRVVATTIVSSQLLGHMARAQGVDFLQTLTGFKWIANAAMKNTAAKPGYFVMGYEEALGYTVGELVRDKDGVSAAVTFAELAAFAKANDQTLLERLDAIYRAYGMFLTQQVSLTLPGSEGLGQIAAAMASFRANPPGEIAGHAVVEHHDLEAGALDLPPSDVLVFYLEGSRRIIMRPSGTEPKLKCYYEVREPVADDEAVDHALSRARDSLAELRDAHQDLVKRTIG